MKHCRVTRRRFTGGLLQSALAAAVAPQFASLRVLAGEAAPSKRIRLGHIGVGGQGSSLLRNFLAVDIALSAAVCDPFRARREAAAGMVNQSQGHDPVRVSDFRELLADRSIDAVVIATPDHWHVPIAVAALNAGKDVYVEKPLGYTLNQNRMMQAAVKRTGRVFQYGTQQRSSELIRRGVELVLNGYIGELKRIEVWAPKGSAGGSLVEIPVPDGLDYDLYLGPAPWVPCTADRIRSAGSWFCRDYSLGFIAGWGAHPLDVALWGTDVDTKGPFTLKGTGVFPTPSALFNTCASWDVELAFAGGIGMRFMSTDIAKPVVEKYRSGAEVNGTTFFGAKGWVSLSRNTAETSNPEWIKLRQCEGDRRVRYHARYYRAFVESVRDRTPSLAPIEDAVRTDAISHLSLLAIESGGEVTWDPAAYTVVSPESLKARMTAPMRGKWL